MELLWLVVMGLFAYVLIGNITQFFENENSPVVTEAATLLRLRRHHHHNGNHHHTSHSAEFELARSGQVIRCSLSGRVWRKLEEGGYGLLTHQGTRFFRFEWDGYRVER